MPAPSFEEVYGQLSADEKKLFDSTLTKHPELKAGWLRQDDYSRKTQELASQKKDYEEAIAEKAKYDEWADRTIPVWKRLAEQGIVDEETGEELWTKQKSELEQQLSEAKAAALAGGDMDPKELDRRVTEIVKANGGVTKEEMAALIQSEAKKLASEVFTEQWQGKEKDFNEKTIPFVAGFSAGTAVVASQFEKETGEAWTKERQAQMFELMAAKKNFDPFAVKEEMIAPFKAKKDQEAEIERRVQERVQATKGMPGSGDEPFIPEAEKAKGALRQMLDRSAETEGDTMTLIMNKAREAGAAMRSEGKA
jgi:hypothetical protein